MNTKQIEELKKKYPLIEVPNIDWVRQQTAKEIIEMLNDDSNCEEWWENKNGDMCFYVRGDLLTKEIKSKYGIGEKVGNNSK